MTDYLASSLAITGLGNMGVPDALTLDGQFRDSERIDESPLEPRVALEAPGAADPFGRAPMKCEEMRTQPYLVKVSPRAQLVSSRGILLGHALRSRPNPTRL